MSPPHQLRQQTSNCSSLLIYRPRKDERLSWPGWLTYSGWFTHISGHPSATSRAQDSESTSAKDQCSSAGPVMTAVGTCTMKRTPIKRSPLHQQDGLSWAETESICSTTSISLNISGQAANNAGQSSTIPRSKLRCAYCIVNSSTTAQTTVHVSD